MTDARQWRVRFTWKADTGVTFPERSYGDPTPDRDDAVDAAFATWSAKHNWLTITGVEIQELPDGPWVDLEPELPCCGMTPTCARRAEDEQEVPVLDGAQ